MNKIKTKVSRETNFVYHMLSVAKCGYDNEYGTKYAAPLHSADDLEVLKKNETLITVKGGEHCGELYWWLVSLPASSDEAASLYYEAFKQEHHQKSDSITPICDVMIRNYPIFCDKVWEISKA